MSQRIAITGATGLIGQALAARLTAAGDRLVLMLRDPEAGRALFPQAEVHRWSALETSPDPSWLEGLDAVVHLAGTGIADKRWTKRRKELICETRVAGTQNLVSAALGCSRPPSVFISGSAIGFYGDRGFEEVDEESEPGAGFLPETCIKWEAAARPLQDRSRLVLLRSGVVLSTRSGALAKMLPPFRLGLGGALGSGAQYMSWIHLDDEIRLILFLLENDRLSGPINSVAPSPVTNRHFTQILGNVLRRPTFFTAPAAALRMVLGQMADELLLSGQKVIPKRAVQAGFRFRFPELRDALENLMAGEC